MKEDIEAGYFVDPFELDNFQEENIRTLQEEVQKLSEDLSVVNRKKKKNNQYSDAEPEHFINLSKTGNPMVHTTPCLDVGSWNQDVMVAWPDFQAEAFLAELEQFRKRPESNSGYSNEALNKLMKDIYGAEAINKLVKDERSVKKAKKESLESKLRKRIQERLSK